MSFSSSSSSSSSSAKQEALQTKEILDRLAYKSDLLRSRLGSFVGFNIPCRVIDDIEKTSTDLVREKDPAVVLAPNVQSIIDRLKIDVPQKRQNQEQLCPALDRTDARDDVDRRKEKPVASRWEQLLSRADDYADSCSLQKGNIQNKVMAYAERIVPLSQALVSPKGEEELVAILGDFAQVSRSSEYETRREQMVDAWKFVEDICAKSRQSGGDSRRHRPITPVSVRFLEALYLRHVERVLAQFPRDALLMGRPSIVERIKSFVGIKLKRMAPSETVHIAVVNGVACWAVVFYLLRTGHVQEALQYSRQIETLSTRGVSGDNSVSSYIEAYYQELVNASLRAQIQADYNQRSLIGNQDLFLLSVLRVVGKCDIGKKGELSLVVQTSEDWLWLQFRLLQEDSYGLAELQSLVQTMQVDNPLCQFQLFLLTKQFPRALETLWNTDFGKVDAFHFALVFLVFDLLETTATASNSTEEPAIFEAGSRVNFPLMSAVYQKFIARKYLEVNFLVYYSLLLYKFPAVSGEAVTQRVVESSNFSHWLGDIEPSGTVVPGVLAQYRKLLGDLTVAVASKASSLCLSQNRFGEALQLLNLSGDLDRVVQLVNEHLIRLLLQSSPRNDESLRTCQAVVEYYGNSSALLRKISRSEYQKALLLLRLVEFKRLCLEEGDYERALSTMEILDLLPLRGDPSDIVEASRQAEAVKHSRDTGILVYLPEVALLTMQCLSGIYSRVSQRAGIDPGRQQAMRSLSGKARSLITFVSLLQHRIPPEYVSKMARMEMSMI